MASVTSTTKTCVVNAAFLQEIKDSNLQLWATLRHLRTLQLGQQESRIVAKQLVDRLSELRDCIGLEFSLEETYGFIEGGVSSTNFGVADASAAKTQHRELYLQLHEICEQAEEAQYRGTITRDLPLYLGAFDAFDSSLRAHEELESELIRCGLGGGSSRY